MYTMSCFLHNFLLILGIDFLLLQITFIFSPDVSNLSIPFEVYNDTVGEIPEHFYLNFTYQYGQNHIQPPDATVTVNIIDSNENHKQKLPVTRL